MLRHIIMYKYLPEAGGKTKEENLAHAVKLAEAMGREIPEITHFEILVGAAGQKDTNYDIALICDMADFDALAAYKANPAHKAYGEFSHSVSESRAAIDIEL